MCGRFTLRTPAAEVARLFADLELTLPDLIPRYNIAPTDPVGVIVEYRGERALAQHRWGLVPYWAKDLTIGSRMINARAETVTTAPAFRESFVARRCIIPATRFYEWQGVGRAKVPYTILRSDGYPMSFAGLWASWRNRETDERLLSCSIITTTPNAVVAALHDRMPVVLPDDTLERWLDPDYHDLVALQSLLRPCADDELYAYPVSRLVNDVRNDGPELIVPME